MRRRRASGWRGVDPRHTAQARSRCGFRPRMPQIRDAQPRVRVRDGRTRALAARTATATEVASEGDAPRAAICATCSTKQAASEGRRGSSGRHLAPSPPVADERGEWRVHPLDVGRGRAPHPVGQIPDVRRAESGPRSRTGTLVRPTAAPVRSVAQPPTSQSRIGQSPCYQFAEEVRQAMRGPAVRASSRLPCPPQIARSAAWAISGRGASPLRQPPPHAWANGERGRGHGLCCARRWSVMSMVTAAVGGCAGERFTRAARDRAGRWVSCCTACTRPQPALRCRYLVRDMRRYQSIWVCFR